MSDTEGDPGNDVGLANVAALGHPALERVLGRLPGLSGELSSAVKREQKSQDCFERPSTECYSREELSIDIRGDPEVLFGEGSAATDERVGLGEEGREVLAHDL